MWGVTRGVVGPLGLPRSTADKPARVEKNGAGLVADATWTSRPPPGAAGRRAARAGSGRNRLPPKPCPAGPVSRYSDRRVRGVAAAVTGPAHARPPEATLPWPGVLRQVAG